MSCTVCNAQPCCCPSINCCSETIEYTGENINLVGTGVFDNLFGTEFQFRGITGISPIVATYNDVLNVVEISFNASSFKQQATFTDSAARNSATPAFLGQWGIQIDTGKGYVGTSLVAGGWTIFVP